MTDQSVMDLGDSERERLLAKIAQLQRDLAQAHTERDSLSARLADTQLFLDMARRERDQAALKRDEWEFGWKQEFGEKGVLARQVSALNRQLNEACGWAMWAGMLAGGVEAEREACARAIEAGTCSKAWPGSGHENCGCCDREREMAAIIRARGSALFCAQP